MSEPTDPRMAFVLMVKPHLQDPHIQVIAKILASDQYKGFFEAHFSHGSSRWDRAGGLAEATLMGYRALCFLMATADQLYGKVNQDRMVAIFLTLMASRWASMRTLKVTFERDQPASATTVAVANAAAFGIDITPAEAQALTCWHYSRREMNQCHEGFTPEWWVLSQTMEWIFAANRR